MECGGDVGWFEYRLSGTVKQKEEYKVKLLQALTAIQTRIRTERKEILLLKKLLVNEISIE